MDCLDCARVSECHSDLLNDMQIVECVRMELDHYRVEQAKEELDILMKRLRRRNEEITGR